MFERYRSKTNAERGLVLCEPRGRPLHRYQYAIFSNMSGPEPGWEQSPGGTGAYTRPLLGSEIWTDQGMRLSDGLSQFAIGIQFTTTIHERDIEARVREAVVRLRFECPLVAATIERGLHHPEFGSWLYAPLANVEAARNWADKTVYYLPDPVDPSSFLQSTVEKHKIPYVLADGSEQFLRVYLTCPNSTLNAYFLALHASHSILDAKPGLNALSLLLQWMTTPHLESIADLAWGTEHKNLPPGPITMTGGPRKDWSTNGTALVEKFNAAFADQTPSHGLDCDTSRDRNPEKPHRLLIKFTAAESAKIMQTLKALGFTFSELIDAATIVAAFEQNPVPADKADTAHHRDHRPPPAHRRPPQAHRLLHRLHTLPHRLRPALPARRQGAPARGDAPGKGAVRRVAREPMPPAPIAELAPQIAPTKADHKTPGPGTYAPTMTNVGRVENYVAPLWPRDLRPGEAPVIRMDDMHIACRMGSVWFTPCMTVHTWSMQGRLSVLLQAADVWDKDVLQDFISGIAKQISFIVVE
ncbi:hypothetical protein LXA43DRAFT_1067335 [Ganoderma leucocontextum]|nr:hypothetical protein LXA43DRAFT_1067335 [Ganoderma leucocontextum]